ncbi:hypothetical protein EV360DRAFT_73352 [Lentinula raphanica]|nr:hypothetical protein EV360DRAFT_73352 [Lentinula raphanica]
MHVLQKELQIRSTGATEPVSDTTQCWFQHYLILTQTLVLTLDSLNPSQEESSHLRMVHVAYGLTILVLPRSLHKASRVMKYFLLGVFVALSITGAQAAPLPVEGEFQPIIERGGPGSSSWPPSWMKSSESSPVLLRRGGPGSSSWPPPWLKSSTDESKRAILKRGGPGSSSWPPSWMKGTEDKATMLIRSESVGALDIYSSQNDTDPMNLASL